MTRDEEERIDKIIDQELGEYATNDLREAIKDAISKGKIYVEEGV